MAHILPAHGFAARIAIAGLLALGLAACESFDDAMFGEENGATVQPVSRADQVFISPGTETGTAVGGRVTQLRDETRSVAAAMPGFRQRLTALDASMGASAGVYHAQKADILARLQVGTTRGNPELVAKWNTSQGALDAMTTDINALNALSAEVAAGAAQTNYLIESVRATFAIPGAVDEDHRQLTVLEDELEQMTVIFDRLLADLTVDTQRQTAYVANERANLTTLANAIKNGELFGPSVTTTLAGPFSPAAAQASAPAGAAFAGPPLVTIRFDRPDVDYTATLYTALTQALEQRPTANFDVVAVSPAVGGPASIQVAQARSRRHAEDVLRTMTDMGLPAGRLRLSSTTDQNAGVNEVRIYLR